MASQPSDRGDGDDEAQREVDSGLDAELDRAVPPLGEAEAFLIGAGGTVTGRVFALTHNTVLLGRAPEADVLLADPSVSAQHARIINSARGFEIEDLGSTNGTFVNGRRIKHGSLQGGDRLTLGQVDLNFMFERATEATVAVFSPEARAIEPARGSLMRLPQAQFPRFLPQGDSLSSPRREEDEGPSLAETIGRLIRAYRFLRGYAHVIAGLAALGIVLGFVSLVVAPPAAEAICEVKLQAQIKSNPMDPQAPRSDNDEMQFFAGAEHAFTSMDLVAASYAKFVGRPPSEAEVLPIEARLKFEALPDHIYRATYKDKTFGRGFPPPVEFLKTHLQNYVESEIGKALRVFTAQADFLRSQLAAVEKEMNTIGAERAKYREKNVDRLPEEAELAENSRFTLETRKAELTGQIRRLQGELETSRHALTAEVPVAQTRFQASQSYRDSLAAVNRKLSEAYARGLADGHPEVRQLNEEKKHFEELIEKEMKSDTNQLDRQSNAGLQELRSHVEALQGQLSAAKKDLADTEVSLGQMRHVVVDLPRVEEKVKQLNHTQEATTHLHSQLFEQLKKAELQLSLERVSAESRYEIVTPPQLEQTRRMKRWGTRGGIGLAVGLFCAALWIAIREGRRIVSQTLATMNDDDQQPTWR